MRIRSVDTAIVEIPFDDGGKGEGLTPTAWRTLETMLVRVEDHDGNVGWGDGFGYFTAHATKAVVDRLIAPLLLEQEIVDIERWNLATQRRLHLFGRYGITIFAISGVDIALWDLAAKRAGVPLYRLLGARSARATPFYASLVRYGDSGLVEEKCREAIEYGFGSLKLHELTLPEIRAGRDALGAHVPIAVDVNCNWSQERAQGMLEPLAELGVSWLEEPVFPPEDFGALAGLRGERLPVAAGENWCTATQFGAAFQQDAVDFAQPSVTKVGGVSEFLKVARLAADRGVELLPHTPYFGPGFFASLHLAAALPAVRQLEYNFVEPAAWLVDPGRPGPGGTYAPSEVPGIGFEPDPEVLTRYQVAGDVLAVGTAVTGRGVRRTVEER